MASRNDEGSSTVEARGAGADLGPGAVRGFRVEVVEGPGAGTAYESEGARCTIGSNASCQLAIDDPTVSRFHCEVAIEPGGARVRDLGSRNGTIVDGTRVVDAYCRGGSTLRLGRSVVRFQYQARANPLPLSDRDRFGELAGTSPAMRAVYAVLERAAEHDVTVLLEGETGTGKSAAARSIHGAAARADGPLVTVECGAIPATLLESELFGHERGAFTGADAAREGAFEEADRGTIFLDEIGEMPLELQPKLLGAVENRAVRRVGGRGQRPIDVRVIAATNRDLRAEVNAGRFREDLYFRLAVVNVRLPPLRARPEDLLPTVARLLDDLGAPDELRDRLTAPERLRQMAADAWPGNVRELRNYLERCLLFEDAPPHTPGIDAAGGATDGGVPVDASLPFAPARQKALESFERAYLDKVLRACGGKVSRAAAAAGIDRTYFYKLLRRHRDE